jgi:hypothetical protein
VEAALAAVQKKLDAVEACAAKTANGVQVAARIPPCTARGVCMA